MEKSEIETQIAQQSARDAVAIAAQTERRAELLQTLRRTQCRFWDALRAMEEELEIETIDGEQDFENTDVETIIANRGKVYEL